MESFFTFLIKLITIFFGCGFMSLIAMWVIGETSLLVRILLKNKVDNDKRDISVIKRIEKISAMSGMYEIALSEGKTINLFSSHKGMKLV